MELNLQLGSASSLFINLHSAISQGHFHHWCMKFSVRSQLAPVKIYCTSLSFKKYRQRLKINCFSVPLFKTSKRHLRNKTSTFEDNSTFTNKICHVDLWLQQLCSMFNECGSNSWT